MSEMNPNENENLDEKIKEVTDDKNVKRWYVVNTYVGHERRVKENLEKRVETMGIQDSLFRIVVAEEPVTEIKMVTAKDPATGKSIKDETGHVKKVKKEIETYRNLFPGYIFVEMKMTDEAWYVVRNTPGVTGFIGSSGGGAKPFPVAPVEMESILRRMGQSDVKVDIDFQAGDLVRVLSGPFSGMEGKISTMNDQTQVASVLINLFGRETPTDISYSDLEKVKDTL